MAYYLAGDYYRQAGGFASILGGILGAAGKVASTIGVPVLGTAATAASRLLTPSRTTTPTPMPVKTTTRVMAPTPTPGIRGFMERAVPGGASGYQCPGGGGGGACGPGFHLDKTEGVKCVRNRRTNYTNPRALSRATKRLDGFVSVARKAMKSTNYKVVSKSYKQNWRKPLKR